MSDVIEGLKLIQHNAGGVNIPDDPTYPYRLEASFRPPELMIVTFIALHGGSENIVVRGMTQEALEEFVEENDLKNHPRLRSLTITGPEDEVILSLPE